MSDHVFEVGDYVKYVGPYKNGTTSDYGFIKEIDAPGKIWVQWQSGDYLWVYANDISLVKRAGKGEAVAETEVPTIKSLGDIELRDYFAANVDHEVNIGDDLAFAERIMGRPVPEDDQIEMIKYAFELDARLRYMKADAMLRARQDSKNKV